MAGLTVSWGCFIGSSRTLSKKAGGAQLKVLHTLCQEGDRYCPLKGLDRLFILQQLLWQKPHEVFCCCCCRASRWKAAIGTSLRLLELQPKGPFTAAWRFSCSHTADTAGAWVTDPAGITLALTEKNGIEDKLQVQAGMWETVRWELPERVNLKRSVWHPGRTEFSWAVTDLCQQEQDTVKD